MLLAFVLIGIAAVSMINFKSVSGSVNQIAEEHLPGLNFLLQADRDLHQAQVAERTLLSTPVGSREQQQLIDTFNENLQQAERRVGRFMELTSVTEERQMVNDYQAKNEQWQQVARQVIELHNQGQTQRAVELSRTESGPLFATMRNVLDQLEQRKEEVALNQSDLISGVIEQSNWTQIVVLLVGLAICVLLALFFPRLITKPLDMLLTRFEDMAKGEGDLTARIHLERNDAATAARTANEHTEDGRAVVDSTVQATTALADQVHQITETISRVADDSNNISKVLDVIGGIAEQTNLLALNAAIESARAGEHGRGFSVVADEVRTLASRTQQSTQEIQEMIDSLQNASNTAVNSMEEGQSRADNTVDKAKSAGESLQSINHAVSEINDMNSYIATAADEQNSVTDDINENVSTITNISERSAESSSQVKEASDSLARLSLSLQNELRQFRIH